MSRWKKIASAALAGIMTVSLAACGGKDDGGSSADGGGEELVIAIWDTQQEPGLTEITDKFTEETGIKCKIQVTPWDQYWTMLEAGATGGSMPDIFWMHSNMINQYAEYDMLLDLTDAITEYGVELDKYPEGIVSLYQNEDGKQLGIPKDMDTSALWYNKTMFDEAEIDYPDETWTWDTLAETAKKLTKEDGSQYGFVISPAANQEGYYNMIYDWGWRSHQ